MTYEEEQFLTAYKNWEAIVRRRPESGVYQGYYSETAETQTIVDGKSFITKRQIPLEEQAEDFKAWRVYVYAREKWLSKLLEPKFE